MRKKSSSIYLDYSSATPVRAEVARAMCHYFMDDFGNPSSIHTAGRTARKAVDEARYSVSQILNADPREVVFTGSGTESINLAIQGIFRAQGEILLKKGITPHIITSNAEHSAVLNTCKFLESHYGCKVTYLPVDHYGKISPEQVKSALKNSTKNEKIILVTIMYANNEIGTINPIKEIGEVCREAGELFHTDACQAGGALSLDTKSLNVDLMTLNGSKIYGPKGVGILYKKKGIELVPLFFGGEGQEHRLRSGTENVPAIVGFAVSLKLAQEEKDAETMRLLRLRSIAEKELLSLPQTFLNGHPDTTRPGTERLANNINICFTGAEGEMLIIKLDTLGIYISTGSACTSGAVDPSHVLLAIGRTKHLANCSARITLGASTTKKQLLIAIDAIKKAVAELRKNSPVYNENV